MSEQGQSVEQLQAQIEAARSRLAGTIDELAFRAQPQQIVARQKESVRASFAQATHTEDGSLRAERIAAVLAVVAALAIGLGLLRRRRR
jgi:anti-sigma-K factor RskA